MRMVLSAAAVRKVSLSMRATAHSGPVCAFSVAWQLKVEEEVSAVDQTRAVWSQDPDTSTSPLHVRHDTEEDRQRYTI